MKQQVYNCDDFFCLNNFTIKKDNKDDIVLASFFLPYMNVKLEILLSKKESFHCLETHILKYSSVQQT